MKQQLHRHGEVVLKQTTLPEGARLIEKGKSLIVGHSESGHHHVLTLPKLEIKMFEFEGRTYLDVPLEAKLEHQKVGVETHGTQVISPGIYERNIKRAYSYAEKLMKRVVD
jgi:hypothetical protein